ncbi:MAG TPA: TIGR03364 family FAD-dependent oxidoreductase [Alloacidobacterium sp.]|nr:TIGR03364 family FAD-dependent oxidoreductase [Alloacidobacterium sp.]
MVTENRADVLIVGAGIIGLAHAWIAAKSGRKVVVLERRPAATGASIANFGLLWPIGQPSGRMLTLAMRSRDLWLEVLRETAIPYSATGSLHIACREDEAQVGKEFAALSPALGYQCSWLDREAALARSPALIPETVLGALWSETEITVDPREVLRRLPEFLHQHYAVEFHWGCPVIEIYHPRVDTAQGSWQADQVTVCTGSDFEILYPDFFRQSGITRCRLQMMRTPPQPTGWELGPAIAGGLTFRFYPSFGVCPSLPALRARIEKETPEYDRFGIHTMVSQASSGELTLGDSHEYGLLVSPFSREEIDALILRHLQSFLRIPDFSIAQRWYGVYAKHPERPYVRFQPQEGVEVITALGGAGMTLSFGVAAETFGNLHAKGDQA